MKARPLILLMAVLVLLLTGSHAIAALRSFGPVSQSTGFFPAWYMDNNGEVMELCIPSPGVELQDGYCLLLPEDVPNPNIPMSFPDNWSEEAFWWSAGAAIDDLPGGGSADLVIALEAAFGGGPVAAGDQVSFGRVRIRVDAPVAGTYTVTHPFGVHTFTVTEEEAGARAINFTEDIGLGTPGDFRGALGSRIGPFLKASATPGGAPLPYHTNPALPGKLYLADPAVTTKVTGGQFNVFRVEGPAGFGTVETSDFSLQGRVFNGSPTTVERATYSRTGTSARIEAFADSAVGATLAVGAAVSPQAAMQGADGKYYGTFSATALPPLLEVTASQPGKEVTRVEKALSDLVTVTRAEFDRATGVLTVAAASSDDNVASLTAQDLGIVPNGGTATFTSPVPPAFVTITSPQGGSDTEPVTVLQGEPGNQSPFAAPDQYTTLGGAVLAVPAPGVLGNDSDPDGNTPLTAILVTNVSSGILTLNADGSFTYSPNPGFSGSDSFTYNARDSLGGLSPAATVTIAVVAPNIAPVAVNDSYSVNSGATLNVAAPGVLGNDSDPDGNIPLTAVLASGVTNGALTFNANGSFTYLPNAGFSGSDSFTYNARDSLGALSPTATVTLNVVAVNVPPVAANDSYSITAGGTLNVAAPGVLGNDSDPNGNTPLTAVLATNVSSGTLTLNPNGSFTYTPNAGFSGVDSFTYRVRDSLGALSASATVSITVNPIVPEIIVVTTAEFRLTGNEWRVEGTSSPAGVGTGNTVTIYLGPLSGGTVIGTATVQADGTWRFRQAGINPGTIRTISVRSSSGTTVQNVTLRVRF